MIKKMSINARLLALTLVVLVVLAGGGWMAWRGGEARANGVLTREEIDQLAVRAGVEDRALWLRLARETLRVENVQPIVAPVEPVNNRGDAARVELGYRLFFDPVLSGDRTTSCSSCHHPDYGMADGLDRAVGLGGRGDGPQRAGTGRRLTRNTPSVFNSAFSPIQFWDGRAGSLEEQALVPILSEDEMNVRDIGEVVRRLRAVPRYRELFANAFGYNSPGDGSEITPANITRALAAFERKLNIVDTAYDRFVAGDDSRLSTSQLRGMVTFFGRGQCAVCHVAPHFHDGVLASTGVPASLEKGAPLDSDPGFASVVRRRDAFGQFRTPGLRNVSRTAPYMHNGIFRTLEEVVDFYNEGGGRGRGIDVVNQDSRVTRLDLDERGRQDLVAFLRALDSLEPPPVVARPLSVVSR